MSGYERGNSKTGHSGKIAVGEKIPFPTSVLPSQQQRRGNSEKSYYDEGGNNTPLTSGTLRTHLLTRANPTHPPPSPTATLLTRSREEGQKRKSYVVGRDGEDKGGRGIGGGGVSGEKALLQKQNKLVMAFAEEGPAIERSMTTRRAISALAVTASSPSTTSTMIPTLTSAAPNFNAPTSIREASFFNYDIPLLLDSLRRDLYDSLPFAAPGVGILLAHFPCMLLLKLIGPGKLIAIALLLSAIVTGVYPLVVDKGQWVVVGLRFLMGVAFAPALPFVAMSAFNWASVKEQLLFVLLGGFVAMQIAPAACWLIAHHFTHSLLMRNDASHVYWLLAGISALLMLVLLVFYRDTPQQHRWVRGIELNIIVAGKSPSPSRNYRLSSANSEHDPATVTCPSMLPKSLSVWAVWLAAVGYFLAHSLFAQFLPHYMYTVLRQPLGQGMIVAPFVFLAGGHLVGYALNKCLGAATSWKVRLMNTAGMVASAVLFLALALLQPRGDWMPGPSPLLFLPFCLIPLGLFTTAGFINSAVVVGRAYSRLIFSHIQLIFAVTWIFVPLLVHFTLDPTAILTADGMRSRVPFLFVSLLLLISASVFAIFGSGRPSGWAERSWSEDAGEPQIGQTTPFLGGRRESVGSEEMDCGVLEMRTLNGSGH